MRFAPPQSLFNAITEHRKAFEIEEVGEEAPFSAVRVSQQEAINYVDTPNIYAVIAHFELKTEETT